MTEQAEAAARQAVADQIAAGSARGDAPIPWAVSYAFDPTSPDESLRIEAIARSVREGAVAGPDWNVAATLADGSPLRPIADLDAARGPVADEVWLQYDFGGDAVGDSDGWERTIPGDEWTRRAYLESDEQDVDEDSEAATLTIRFHEGSTVPAEVYAIDAGGNVFGAIDLAPRAAL